MKENEKKPAKMLHWIGNAIIAIPVTLYGPALSMSSHPLSSRLRLF